MEENKILNQTVDIVTAFVTKNSVPVAELHNLIRSVHTSLNGLGQAVEQPLEAKQPAVSVKKSVGADYIICLDDGRKFKSLKRHLRTKYNMSPEDYRAKWGLPKDYPMVAPSYSESRSKLAKQMGLGAGGRTTAPKRARKPATE